MIVGVDGSETADRAAEEAARLAAGFGARLHVVTAYDRTSAETIEIGTDRWTVNTDDEAAATADAVAARLRSIHADVTSTAIEGDPDEVLIEEAKRLDARTIVVGNRRMQGISRVLGSVANGVAHHAPCHVYIVHTVD